MGVRNTPDSLWPGARGDTVSDPSADNVFEERRENLKTHKAVDAGKIQDIVDQIRRLSVECEKEISRRRLLEAVTTSLDSSTLKDEECSSDRPGALEEAR